MLISTRMITFTVAINADSLRGIHVMYLLLFCNFLSSLDCIPSGPRTVK